MQTRGDWRGIVDVVKRTGYLWWRSWPWLVAIYVVGWLARYGALKLAIYVSVHFGGVWSSLVFPLVGLARLLTYVGMFLVLRSAVVGERLTFQTTVGVLLRSILPVFVLFAVWKVNLEDLDQYNYIRRLMYSMPNRLDTPKPAEQVRQFVTPDDWRVYAVIAVAFVVRMLLTRYKDKLPQWTQLVALYCEALWVQLLVIAAGRRLLGSPTWLAERRFVVWYNAQKDWVLSHLGGLAKLWSWSSEITGNAIPAVLIPLTWLAIGGVVFAVAPSLGWGGVENRIRDHVFTQGVQSRWGRLPQSARGRGVEVLQSILGLVHTIADSIRLALRAGPLVLAFYILAFTVVVALYPTGSFYDPLVSDGFAWRGVVMIIGPHDIEWWQSYIVPIRLGIGAALDPLRVCLVAAMYWYCLDRVRAEDAVSDAKQDESIGS